MDLPEEIQKLVSELGDSLLNSLAEDPACRDLALRIQEHGYDLCLVLEATLAAREEREEETVPSGAWSDEDARVLQDFRIALD
ncbi:MAG TPA: hypothetical protein VFF77_02225 [Holophagaceae bacterium]|jgi:hypothetical protein|nr:hypothetical protein [Holophagaceae bacterium]